MKDQINTARILIATLSTLALPALAAPFTYQGSLQDEGLPANGTYDIRFQLYDAQSGGSQLGATINYNDVQVTDGTFQVEIDFNNTFDESDAYLNIQVRDGDSTGTYTTLLPRSPITATPKAHFADTAASVENPLWETTGSSLINTPLTNKLLINRSNQITGNEVFGFYGNIAGFVGMYAAGPENSSPFYGYSVENEVNAYTYYSGANQTWTLQLNADTPITADGPDIIAGNNVIANDFQYKNPKTNYISIMGDSFHAASNDPFIASSANGGAYITTTGSGWLVAPVQFPQGAVITKLRAYITDNTATSDLTASLFRKSHGVTGLIAMASTSSNGLSGFSLLVEDNTISTPLVNNNLSSYQLRIYSPNWPGDSSLRIESVVIEYTTTQAD